MRIASLLALVFCAAAFAHGAGSEQYFTIKVIDKATGRGVPLVELRTVNNIRSFTDSNGIIAFQEPGLMGKDVFFSVSSHGYEFPKDGFGFRGKALRVVPGGEATLSIQRLNIAERLYRITGAGIYRDSTLVGVKVPIKEPVLNGLVFGSDSVINAVYKGKIQWFWGDTNKPSYPLGNFQVPGATSELPANGGLDPDVGIDFTYLVDDKGFAKPTTRIEGKGPTWLTSAATLTDKTGRERLVGSYVKVEPPLTIYARGLAVFDDDKQVFEKSLAVDMKSHAFPDGHAFKRKEGGVEYLYFSHPFPVLRVPATFEDFQRLESYESFTCLKEDAEIDREADGRARYAWRKNVPAIKQKDEAKLLSTGKIKAADARFQLRDRAGKPVMAHGGSVYWNEFRKRWVMIFVQSPGSSFLGEVWYAEADSPVGPWTETIKVVTHDRYSFYNPKQHPMFDKEGGRFIYFEGTYTHTFSGNSDATPRYDYNQIMYKLDLADARLPAKP